MPRSRVSSAKASKTSVPNTSKINSRTIISGNKGQDMHQMKALEVGLESCTDKMMINNEKRNYEVQGPFNEFGTVANNTGFLVHEGTEFNRSDHLDLEGEYYESDKHAGDGHNVSINARHEPAKVAHGDFQRITAGATVTRKQRKYVIDYANLRKSGYFLERQNTPVRREPPVGLITSNIQMETPRSDERQVVEWIKALPYDSHLLEDSDDDLMGKREIFDITRHELLSKHMNDEDHFKNMILEYGNVIRYTSKPAKTWSYLKTQAVLESASEVVDAYLEKVRKDKGYFEHEYVCGKVTFPSDWTNEKEPTVKAKRGGISSWFRHWLPLQSNIAVGNDRMFPEAVHAERNPNAGEEPLTMNQIVLEPYHGPIFVNGAVIEAGTANPLAKKGIFGNILEEVKAALQAIHHALRKKDLTTQPPPVSPASSALQMNHPTGDDPEIQKLTEMLQSKQQGKKSNTPRSVFVLRNLDKAPEYNYNAILGRRGNRMTGRVRGRQRGIRFIRALNGWIQRDGNRHQYYNYRYQLFRNMALAQDIENLVHSNDVPIPVEIQEPLPPPPQPISQRNHHSQKTNFLSSTMSHMISMMKSVVPFTLTPEPSPAIPAFQCDYQIAPPTTSTPQTQPRQHLPRSVRQQERNSSRESIPTRYNMRHVASAVRSGKNRRPSLNRKGKRSQF